MSSDFYIVTEHFEEYENQIRRLIDDIARDFHYLERYRETFFGHLTDLSESEVEDKTKQPGYIFRDYGLSTYFPITLDYSLIIIAFQTLENHLRIMTNILFDQKGLPGRFHDYLRKTYKGGNFEKYLAFYVDQVGGSHYSDKKYWPQVDRLNKIRNCIVHISGFIGDSRDKEELIRIVKSRDYLHKDDQSGPRVELWVKEGAITNRNEGYYDLGEIDIEGCEDDGDERLVIGGGYCNRMCWYLRSFAIEMIERTDMVVYANWDD